MTEAVERADRIRAKIAASQERLRQGNPSPVRIPQDAEPPESLAGLAGQHPVATLAGGLALGLLVGALVPRRFGGKLGSRVASAAMIAGELGLAYATRARSSAAEAGRDGVDAIRRGAATVNGRAQGSGLAIAREVVKLAARVRR